MCVLSACCTQRGLYLHPGTCIICQPLLLSRMIETNDRPHHLKTFPSCCFVLRWFPESGIGHTESPQEEGATFPVSLCGTAVVAICFCVLSACRFHPAPQETLRPRWCRHCRVVYPLRVLDTISLAAHFQTYTVGSYYNPKS